MDHPPQNPEGWHRHAQPWPPPPEHVSRSRKPVDEPRSEHPVEPFDPQMTRPLDGLLPDVGKSPNSEAFGSAPLAPPPNRVDQPAHPYVPAGANRPVHAPVDDHQRALLNTSHLDYVPRQSVQGWEPPAIALWELRRRAVPILFGIGCLVATIIIVNALRDVPDIFDRPLGEVVAVDGPSAGASSNDSGRTDSRALADVAGSTVSLDIGNNTGNGDTGPAPLAASTIAGGLSTSSSDGVSTTDPEEDEETSETEEDETTTTEDSVTTEETSSSTTTTTEEEESTTTTAAPTTRTTTTTRPSTTTTTSRFTWFLTTRRTTSSTTTTRPPTTTTTERVTTTTTTERTTTTAEETTTTEEETTTTEEEESTTTTEEEEETTTTEGESSPTVEADGDEAADTTSEGGAS